MGRRSRTRLAAAAVAAVTALGIGGARLPSRADGCIPQANLAPPEWDLTYWINTTRLQHGLPALAVDSRMETVARSWVVQMAQSGQVAHNPNLAAQAPADWQYLGENVGSGPSLPAVNSAFMASSEHFTNIVDPSYNAMGVAAVNVNGVVYVVEDFEYSSSAANQCR